jgi:hypothetical protein
MTHTKNKEKVCERIGACYSYKKFSADGAQIIKKQINFKFYFQCAE